MKGAAEPPRLRKDDPLGRLVEAAQWLARFLPQPLLVCGPDHRILWANPAAETFWQMSPPELARVDLADFIEGFPPPLEGETECYVHLSGRPRAAVMTFRIIGGPDRPLGHLIFLKDISQEKLISQELKALQQNIDRKVARRTRDLILKEREDLSSQMVQGIVHNFRSPLHGLQASLAVLRRRLDKLDQPALSEPLGLVEEGARRLSDLVSHLLHRSRRSYEEEPSLLDLNELIRQELNLLESDLFFLEEAHKEIDLAPDLPKILGTTSALSQVFQNLVRNALDAMWSSPVKNLAIRTFVWNASVCLTVEDSGPGIAEEIKDKIFDPFFTTKPLTREGPDKPPAGTGLGLALSQQLLRPLGGRISVDSRPGGPTIFTVQLPLINPLPLEQSF